MVGTSELCVDLGVSVLVSCGPWCMDDVTNIHLSCEETVNVGIYGSGSAVGPVVGTASTASMVSLGYMSLTAVVSAPIVIAASSPSVLMSHYVTLYLIVKVWSKASDYLVTHSSTVGIHMFPISAGSGGIRGRLSPGAARGSVAAGAGPKSPPIGCPKSVLMSAHTVTGRSVSAVSDLTAECSLLIASIRSPTGGVRHMSGMSPHSVKCTFHVYVTRYSPASGGRASYPAVIHVSSSGVFVGVRSALLLGCCFVLLILGR